MVTPCPVRGAYIAQHERLFGVPTAVFRFILAFACIEWKMGVFTPVSLNLSYRITHEFLIEDDRIVLVNVGDHDDVYR